MKTKKQILLLLVFLLTALPPLSAQSKKEKEAQKKAAVKELIVSENYKIDANTAFPMRGRSIPLTFRYFLEIRNDSVISYLPYYGRAYGIPYGGGDGLIFKALIKEYTMFMDKKDKARIKFKVRKPGDQCEYNVLIYDNGSATIDVNMQNRQPIRFLGELYIPETKK